MKRKEPAYEYPQATLEGFVYYFRLNGKGKQHGPLLAALARIARDHPNADPRKVIIEYLAENLVAYERTLDRYKLGIK